MGSSHASTGSSSAHQHYLWIRFTLEGLVLWPIMDRPVDKESLGKASRLLSSGIWRTWEQNFYSGGWYRSRVIFDGFRVRKRKRSGGLKSQNVTRMALPRVCFEIRGKVRYLSIMSFKKHLYQSPSQVRTAFWVRESHFSGIMVRTDLKKYVTDDFLKTPKL
jgi:hypothetical protein